MTFWRHYILAEYKFVFRTIANTVHVPVAVRPNFKIDSRSNGWETLAETMNFTYFRDVPFRFY